MLKQYPTARFILQRGGWYFITFLVAVTINFFLPRMGTSDPVEIIMGQSASGLSEDAAHAKKNALLKDFGMAKVDDQGNVIEQKVKSQREVWDSATQSNKMVDVYTMEAVRTSSLEQFGAYLKRSLQGDLGTSYIKNKKVSELILDAIPWTLALQLPTIVFGWIVGNLLGALAAYRRGNFDRIFFPVALFVSAVPFFVFGMLLVYVFAIQFPIFPPTGGFDPGMVREFTFEFFASAAYYYVLPFFSIFLILAGGQAIGMRSMGIYELGTDYIKYAKWLGLKESRVLMYLFRNAMLPQLTGLALSLGTMIGGALITEMIFSYPGLGLAILTAIQNNDYPLIQGCTLLVTVSVLIANFTVDILIGFLDPRVKAGLQMGGN
ncbi:MAG: ABC transporter permease [Fibrobacteres bacterium]|nr:ABC transporter permease [Fibrobacterota bacterium]